MVFLSWWLQHCCIWFISLVQVFNTITIYGTVFIILSRWYNTIMLLHLLRRNCFFPDTSYFFREAWGWCQVGKCKSRKWPWPLQRRLIHARANNSIIRTDTLNPTAKLNYAFQHSYILVTVNMCFGVIPFDWQSFFIFLLYYIFLSFCFPFIFKE